MLRPWEQPYSERFAGRKPRIFVGFLAYGDIDPGVYASSVFWGIQVGARYHDKFEILVETAQKREQYRGRNALIQEAMEAEADFIIMLDDDHTIGDCPTMIGEFYNAEKPVQGGLYVQRRHDNLQPVIQRYNAEKNVCEWITEIPAESGPVDVLGGGVNWFDTTVFHFLEQPFWWPHAEERKVVFIPHQRFGLDMKFCLDVKEQLGIQPWLNMGVQVGHVMSERIVVRPPTMHARTLCQACDSVMEWEGDHWRCESCKANGGDGGEHHLGHADFAHREKFRPGYGQLASALCNTFKFDDALDLGSGQGFLVDELIARGKKVQGVELQPAARDFMSPAARAAIQIGDFTNGASPTGDFGLVTCVEVAEHIEASRSEAVVAACTNTAHEYVYFTADDTPSRLHINPQPKAYWIEKFKKRGFALDESKTEEVKAALDGTPCPWLQKNTMVFRKEAHG